MPMVAAGNQTPLGEKLYFFTSPMQSTTTCLIWAHGGLFHGDGQFVIPNGVNVQFYVDHGTTRKTAPSLAIQAPTFGQNVKASCTLTGPAQMPNYRLRKALGQGFDTDPVCYNQVEQMMAQNQVYAVQSQNDWCPHVVSVRRRLGIQGKTITVGEVITEVIKHDHSINTFIYGGCRSDYSSSKLLSRFIKIAVQVAR